MKENSFWTCYVPWEIIPGLCVLCSEYVCVCLYVCMCAHMHVQKGGAGKMVLMVKCLLLKHEDLSLNPPESTLKSQVLTLRAGIQVWVTKPGCKTLHVKNSPYHRL